jgi:hypothetical protein
MIMKLIRFFFVCIFGLSTIFASAQAFDRDVYRAEIGIIGGGSFYIGDANSLLFNNMQIAYGGFFRYNLNPRFAFKAELISTTVSGPGFNPNNIFAGDITAEFNFFDLENSPYKRFSKTYSPYIFAGMGLFTDMYVKQFENFPNFISLPFGVGMKVKLGKRWNLNAQWSNRLSLLSDNMEDNLNFAEPTNSNIFNNDLLSTVTIGVSYDIWKKKCDCMNTNISK